MVQPIVLYDIPSNNVESKSWSPNCWKARYVLNIKGLPYTTEWVEYPDIASVSKKLGFPPTGTRDGAPLYTLPAIYDPNTEQRISDSKNIAKYLDKTYPDTPQMFPKGTDALQAVFFDAIVEANVALYAILCHPNANILNPSSYKYWIETRGAVFGKKYEDVGTEEDRKTAEAGLGKVKAWLESNEDSDGKLFMGDRIVFADVLLAALLKWAKSADPVTWANIKALHGGKWEGIAQYFSQYE